MVLMRPSLDEYLMDAAILAATRTTCLRRGVGCVLASKRGHIMAVGYNGVAAGLPHCSQKDWKDEVPHACEGWRMAPGLDKCEAIHAEQNALLQCRDPWEIETAYVTLSPCKACLKLLLNTGCKRIVFLEEHIDPLPSELWRKAGRIWEQIKPRS